MAVHVLSVSSLKGGVGKTTVTLGLASAAFAKGLRTLVVDLDPQSDLSTGMDIDVTGRLTVADVLNSPKAKIVRQAIAQSGWTRDSPGTVDVLIGSASAINFDGPRPSARDLWKLETALAHVEGDYDLVLIDCAPSLNALTRTAWAASDRVAVVTEPGLFSVAAADRALRAIEEIRTRLSPRLQPFGIVVNRVREQSIEHQFRIKELRDMFGSLVLAPPAAGAHVAAAGAGRREAAARLARRERRGDGGSLRRAAGAHHARREDRGLRRRSPRVAEVPGPRCRGCRFWGACRVPGLCSGAGFCMRARFRRSVRRPVRNSGESAGSSACRASRTACRGGSPELRTGQRDGSPESRTGPRGSPESGTGRVDLLNEERDRRPISSSRNRARELPE